MVVGSCGSTERDGSFSNNGKNGCVNDLTERNCILSKCKCLKNKAMCYCNRRCSFNGIYSCKYTKLLYIFTVLLILSNVKVCFGYYNEFDESPSNSNWNEDYGESTDFNNEHENSEKNKIYTCVSSGEFLKGYTLRGGLKAGDYQKLGVVDSFDQCAGLCCEETTCNLAIMLTYPDTGERTCFKIECFDPESSSCKSKSATKSKYHPHLFRRGSSKHKHKKVATSEEGSHSIITNEVKSMCHEYTGTVCHGNLDKTKLYYYTASNDSILDNRLRGPIQQISSRLSGSCKAIALQAICYRFYPQCTDPLKPKPVQVCEDECDNLIYGKCAADFAEANMLSYLQHVIPNCGQSGDYKRDTDGQQRCIQLKEDLLPDVASPDEPSNIFHANDTEESTNVNLPNSNSSQSLLPIVSGDTFDKPTSKPLIDSRNNTVANDSLPVEDLNVPENVTSSILTTVSPSHEPTLQQYVKEIQKPAVVDVKDSQDKGTDYQVSNAEIRVSAGENTEIKLPENQVSLYASTWPKEKYDGEYSYKWTQLSAPAKSHAYIEGATLKNIKLTMLDVAGVYNIALKVTSTSGVTGIGYVNVTVKEPKRYNHPPRAEVSPKEQTITLPTNTVVLDGTKSSDDDEIVSYKWEELSGPIEHNTVFGAGTTSKILQIKELIAGEYHFRLTVTDSNGETDSTDATVIVKEEQDYPPEANAGNDLIIHLPNNSVTLNGNKSTDDKNHLTYAWRKTPGSPTCDMQGTDTEYLRISSLTKGTYTFILKVTDTSGQENEARVKVVVLPELNTKPVAVAGDNKELKYPDTSTTLDGSSSSDNSKIVSYMWEKISGPDSIKMVGANSPKVHISDLKVGTYMIRLTVTDDKQLTGVDSVQIKVKKDHNEPPVAVISSGSQIVYLPDHSAVLDGSQSTDDELIASYRWTRAGSSPAAGDIINGSDHSAILRVTNLVKGKYIFDLLVTDEKALTGSASVTITVTEDPNKLFSTVMYLDIDIGKFTEESKKQLIRKISVILEVDRKHVKIEEIAKVHFKRGVMVQFYVEHPNIPNHKLDGKYVADLLKHKVGNGGKLFDFTMLRVEPYVCRNNCSGHGYCDDSTKTCICDTFWMSNFFKAKLGTKESNCDWSILYLSVGIFAVFLLFIGLTWSICYLLARKKRNRRRARYRALRNTDPDSADDEILLIPKAMKEKFTANSLTFTESDEDSEEETTVFDKKRVANGPTRLNESSNGHARLNRPANGKLKYRDHAM